MSNPEDSFKAQVLLNKKLNGVPIGESNDVIVESMQEHAKNCIQAVADEVKEMSIDSKHVTQNSDSYCGYNLHKERVLKILNKYISNE